MTYKKSHRRPSAKLKPQDIIKIRQLLADGVFQNRIAAMYDVNPGRISEIKTGKHPLCFVADHQSAFLF
ncbi:MAG TPA: hypothetical protein VHP34_03275 [Alphaproteobacteria bacterium]|nr:hypothetical protein [Alphaproteobacteria bacterium]